METQTGSRQGGPSQSELRAGDESSPTEVRARPRELLPFRPSFVLFCSHASVSLSAAAQKYVRFWPLNVMLPPPGLHLLDIRCSRIPYPTEKQCPSSPTCAGANRRRGLQRHGRVIPARMEGPVRTLQGPLEPLHGAAECRAARSSSRNCGQCSVHCLHARGLERSARHGARALTRQSVCCDWRKRIAN